jgi:N-acyl-D-aspartate/D-glutamate deacylase
MSVRSNRPVNWNVLTVDSADPDRYRAQIAVGDAAAKRGGKVVALTMPILVGMNMSFLTFCALFLMPGWGDVLNLPLPERMAKLRDPAVRRNLDERAHSPEAGVFTRLADWGRYEIGDTYAAANDGLKGRTVGAIAAERGTAPFDTLLDVVLADDLRTVLWPLPPDDDTESWRLRAEAWQHPYVMIGGSDAGAHLDRMSGAQYPTAFLGDCLRGRQLTTVENAVRLMTAVPAALFGLRDRGIVREGAHADLVLLDPATVDAGPSTMVADLPGGTSRLFTPAVGVDRVFVNGRPIVVDGRATGETPGTLLRSGRDTETVAVR